MISLTPSSRGCVGLFLSWARAGDVRGRGGGWQRPLLCSWLPHRQRQLGRSVAVSRMVCPLQGWGHAPLQAFSGAFMNGRGPRGWVNSGSNSNPFKPSTWRRCSNSLDPIRLALHPLSQCH